MSNLARLHEKAIRGWHSARSALGKHKDKLESGITAAVATGESLAGAASAAGLDWFMGDKTEAIPEAMVGPVPVVPVAALALKGAGFALGFMGSPIARDLHAYADGMGGAAMYAGLMRIFRAQQAAASTTTPAK